MEYSEAREDDIVLSIASVATIAASAAVAFDDDDDGIIPSPPPTTAPLPPRCPVVGIANEETDDDDGRARGSDLAARDREALLLVIANDNEDTGTMHRRNSSSIERTSLAAIAMIIFVESGARQLPPGAYFLGLSSFVLYGTYVLMNSYNTCYL